MTTQLGALDILHFLRHFPVNRDRNVPCLVRIRKSFRPAIQIVDFDALVQLATDSPTEDRNMASNRPIRIEIRAVEGTPGTLGLVYHRGRARSVANTSS